jgi:hypothetical protein
MGQTFYDDVYAGGHIASTDLQNIETNFATLKSQFSGASAPAAVAGQPFFDTNNDVLKVRNAAASAWRGQLHSDGNTFKILCYRNDAPDGYTIDTALTSDRVVAVKNHGSGTYTTGGAAAGTWNNATGLSNNNESAHTHQHNHQWHNFISVSNHTQSYDSGGNPVNLVGGALMIGGNNFIIRGVGDGATPTIGDTYTTNDNSAGTVHTHTVSSASTFRPYAYVFIILYLDGLT